MKTKLFSGIIAVIFAIALTACGSSSGGGSNGNGDGDGDEVFVSSTNETISNDVNSLGLVGTSVSSSNTNVAIAVIASGKIIITSVSNGSAVITVTESSKNATINITVSKTGIITIVNIVKHTEAGNNPFLGSWVFESWEYENENAVAFIFNNDGTLTINGYPGTYNHNVSPATMTFIDDGNTATGTISIVSSSLVVFGFAADFNINGTYQKGGLLTLKDAPVDDYAVYISTTAWTSTITQELMTGSANAINNIKAFVGRTPLGMGFFAVGTKAPIFWNGSSSGTYHVLIVEDLNGFGTWKYKNDVVFSDGINITSFGFSEMTSAVYSGGREPALYIRNDAGNTTVKITTTTITESTDFDTLTGVVATGQGSTPYLYLPGGHITPWTGTGTFNVMLHNPPKAPDGEPPYTIKYQNNVQFIDGFGVVDWNTMSVK